MKWKLNIILFILTSHLFWTYFSKLGRIWIRFVWNSFKFVFTELFGLQIWPNLIFKFGFDQIRRSNLDQIKNQKQFLAWNLVLIQFYAKILPQNIDLFVSKAKYLVKNYLI